ncbi:MULTISPECIES: amidohydrolase family protein [unclassified Curtobacterium]|uniref:amidohydrolase family protein n=1 Tax=unclassified Curtobacterium TaxID=257496 RepID=UPI000F48C967|nr:MULTISPECIES: amidohydrolase family protein [unclassified Curtobacterium]ROQ16629.1 putative TIM-barrel fold metal-dependent hydrolase [Curtobacterium sp. PhB171]ROQ25295.1 putative TIM-barrel fold metal-dependent hydrolase [Curtobacterium sp. PhB170]ROS36747.1 putative TIM-barrel fold metal-dependent hydrolase [Curtobacterium sp. PhB131]ROS71423.1 putative TIM-barrel fold metal-dependent hydrolase [Curtobacterium sp. PhB141]
MSELIDVHAHFVTADYVAAARAAGYEQPDGMPAWPSWSLAGQLGDMDRRGIARAVLSVSSPGVHFGDDDRAAELARTLNDEAAAIAAAHPDRFSYFASLPVPDVDSAVLEARRTLQGPGAVGVVLESNAHGQYLGDPALEPLWAELDARGAAVFVHPTSPVGWEHTALGRPRPMLEFMFDSTRSIVDLVFAGVLDRYPDVRVIVPHSGATLPVLSDRIALFQQLFGATAGTMPWKDAMRRLWFDTAGTPFPLDVPVLAEVAGTDRLLYGSDSCWTPTQGVDAQIAALDDAEPPHDATSWRELTTRNARRLLD